MSSKLGHVMTLANSIIGVGILAMPFCFHQCGIILSIMLLFTSYYITRLCCHYLVKSSILCRKRNFEFLGLHIFGTSGKLMVELCVIGYLMGTCITYFVVVGDLGPQITAKMFNLKETNSLRTWMMALVTVFVVLPLGLLRNVDSLANVCTASIGFYFCLVVKVISESEMHLISFDWLKTVNLWRSEGIMQCLPIFTMALSCQMQLFEVQETITNVSLEKMNEIIKSATGICTGVYLLVGFFGYVAFCTQPFSGNILLNFSDSATSDVIKMGFVLSVAFSFPLVIFPCRASLYSLLYRRGHTDAGHYIPEPRFKCITIFIVLFALSIGLLIPSIELIIGLVGSTIGVAICIMFPASCIIKLATKNSTEKSLAQILLIFGFVLMILGTFANLTAIDENKSGAKIEEAIDIPNIKLEKLVEIPNNLKSDNLTVNIVKLDENGFKADKPPVIKLNDVKPVEPKKDSDSIKINIPENPPGDDKLKPIKDTGPEINIKIKSENDRINNDAINREEQEIAIEETGKNNVNSIETKQLRIEVEKINDELKKRDEQNLLLEKILVKMEEKVENIEQAQIAEEKKIQQIEKKQINDLSPGDDANKDKLINGDQPSINNKPIIPIKLPLPLILTQNNSMTINASKLNDIKISKEIKDDKNDVPNTGQRDILAADVKEHLDRKKRDVEDCDGHNIPDNVISIRDSILDSKIMIGRDLKSINTNNDKNDS